MAPKKRSPAQLASQARAVDSTTKNAKKRRLARNGGTEDDAQEQEQAIVAAAATEALRVAAAEGLTLAPGTGPKGYAGVRSGFPQPLNRRFEAFVTKRANTKSEKRQRDFARSMSLGFFSTPEEAALCYARHQAETVSAALFLLGGP